MSRNVWILSAVMITVTLLTTVAVAFAAQNEGGRGQQKVTICHKGKNTITVGAPALAAHERHGDIEGACQTDAETTLEETTTPPEETTMPEETTTPEETTAPEETTMPEETTTPEETTVSTAADDKGDEIADGATHDAMNGLRRGTDVYGASAADTLRGTPNADFLQGGRGPDRMFAGPGKDYIDGVDGIVGNDKLYGDLGTDHCVGDKGDTFKGCDGNVVEVPVP